MGCVFVIQWRMELFYYCKHGIEFFSVPEKFPNHRNFCLTLIWYETMGIRCRLEWPESPLNLSAKKRLLRQKSWQYLPSLLLSKICLNLFTCTFTYSGNSVRFVTISNYSLKSATSCVAITVRLDHIAVCIILSWLKAPDLAKTISNAYWMANGCPSVVHINVKHQFSRKRVNTRKPHFISCNKTAKIKRKIANLKPSPRRQCQ